MITTVTLNPSLDLTVTLDQLYVGGLNLVRDSRMDVSGKGINVSIVLRELGMNTRCTGINFTENGHLLEERLEQAGIPYHFEMAQGTIRTNIKVVDSARRQMTEINSLGDPVEREVLQRYYKNLTACARDSSLLVFSGRIPNGVQENVYQKSLRFAAGFRVKTVIDADGMPLKMALQDRPYLIKPNIYELGALLGYPIHSKRDVLAACHKLIGQYGVTVVCVSMGEQGAMIVDSKEAWYAPALPLEPVGFQGAGDSMVAGICMGITQGEGIDNMLRNGVAASSASILREGTLLCKKEDYDRLLPLVNVQRV